MTEDMTEFFADYYLPSPPQTEEVPANNISVTEFEDKVWHFRIMKQDKWL
jgi:hypothetical protein